MPVSLRIRSLLIAVLSAIAVALGTGCGSAQTIELLSLTNLWRYEGSGADPGTEWRQASYPDGAWLEGHGVLATESANSIVDTLTRTRLSRTGINGYKITDYFRTRFTLPELRPGWFLIASNLVDDGAVFYLNGGEWFRFNMPTGTVDAATLASRTIGEGHEGIFTSTNLPAVGLVAGENVIAVEVHQPYLTSSDTVLGLALFYAPQEAVAILRHPGNQVIIESGPAGLNVSVSGSLPRFQWFKEGAAIAGATQPVLSFAGARRADAGQYFVIVSNDVSAVTSRVATLTMILDQQPPALVSARKNFYLDVHFSEPIDHDSATNPAQFKITAPGGGTVAVSEVFSFGSHDVALNAGPLTPGFNHLLFVSGIRDQSGNEIAPESGIGIATTITNVPLASVWRYNDSGGNLGDSWRDPAYDDGAWPSGAALLFNDVNLSLNPPGALNTPLRVLNDFGAFWTHYFRLRFTNSASPVGAQLSLRHYLDDGAAFHLNGREIRRVNMASGEVNFDTPASSSAVEGIFSAAIRLPADDLLVGENLLAVEVHQYSLASPTLPDISFGLELTADVTSFIDGPPRILTQPQGLKVNENAPARFLAHIAGAERVQWLRDGAAVPDSSATELELSAAGVELSGSYSITASNSFGMVTSRVARLEIIPDRIPPRLLSVRMGTNETRVLLAFSGRLDAVSAALPDNYAITNELGEALAVLGAALTNGTNVILTTTPRTAGHRYTVVVNGVRDTSAAGNVIFPDSHAGIDYEQLLFGYDWVWRYNESGTNLGTAWRERDYDDSAWPVGPGLLAFENELFLPAPIGTRLVPPEFTGITDYFRTRFSFDGDPARAVLRLRHAIDDGAVFYLNGREVHRIRVPEGQNYRTVTTVAFETEVEGPFELSATALVTGENVLAVEVHQNSAVSADVVFGAELALASPAMPSAPTGPALQFQRTEGRLALFWDAFDFALEHASSPAGPWQLVTQPSMPHVPSQEGGKQFYRLAKP